MATTRAVEVIKKKIPMTAPTGKEPPNAFPKLGPNVSSAVTRGRKMNLLKIKQKVIHIRLIPQKIHSVKLQIKNTICFLREINTEKLIITHKMLHRLNVLIEVFPKRYC